MSYFAPNYNVYQALVNGSLPIIHESESQVNIPESFNLPTYAAPERKSVEPNFNSIVIENKPITEATIDFSSLVTTTPMENMVRQQFEISPVDDPKDVIVYQQIPQQPTLGSLINNPVPDSICNGRKMTNWFTRMIDQRGEDFIAAGKVSVDEVGKNVDRIIDDIIGGRVDFSKHGKYIIEPIIIDTILDYCANKVNLNTANLYTQNYFYSDYVNRGQYVQTDPDRFGILNTNDNMVRNIVRSMSMADRDIGIYTILYNKFMIVKNTKNAMALISLNNELNAYRKLAKNNK
jgi:hypothetical protein